MYSSSRIKEQLIYRPPGYGLPQAQVQEYFLETISIELASVDNTCKVLTFK